jgi:hypothetical protein
MEIFLPLLSAEGGENAAFTEYSFMEKLQLIVVVDGL